MVLSLRSRGTIFTSVFLACVSFAIVMPSLWPYLEGLGANKAFLALVVSFYSVGEGVGALLFGWLSASRRTRYVMVWATLIGALGSAMYAIAEFFPRYMLGAWMVFVGRFFQGMWTGGSQAAQQTHLSKTVTLNELTSVTVSIGAFACLGFVVGPTFALGFEYVTPLCLGGKNLCITQLTAPGYFVLISALATIGLYSYWFDDDDDDALATLSTTTTTLLGTNGHAPDEESGHGDLGKQILGKAQKHEMSRLFGGEGRLGLAIFICNLVYFVHFYGFAVQETITTPLVQAYYNWNIHKANVLFTGAGICSLAVFVLMQWYGSVVDDKSFTYVSLLVGAAGFALLPSELSRPPSVGQFLLAFALITVAFALGRAQCMSLYTKVLPQRLQGAGQGGILAVGALARIVGPFIAVMVFWSDMAGWFVFGATAMVFLTTAVMFRSHYNDLWPRLEAGGSQ